MRCYFSPHDKPAKHLQAALFKAQKRIWIAVYTLTHKALVNALCEAKKRGVDVQVATDIITVEYADHLLTQIKKAGIPLFVYHPTDKRLLHHKFALIDDMVWTGSFNWTHAAATKNFENLLMLTDPEITHAYEKEFYRVCHACTVPVKQSKSEKKQRKKPPFSLVRSFRVPTILSSLKKGLLP